MKLYHRRLLHCNVRVIILLINKNIKNLSDYNINKAVHTYNWSHYLIHQLNNDILIMKNVMYLKNTLRVIKMQ